MSRLSHVRPIVITLGLAAIAAAGACSSDKASGPTVRTRTYAMGFSNFPPAPDTMLERRTVEMWLPRADAAIMHLDVPWVALLGGASADSLVVADVMPIVGLYQGRGLGVVIETDVTNGVDRTAEAPALVAAGRSVTEEAVQQVYRQYIVALATIAAPRYLGLASETNLIRAVAPPGVYAAVVTMTNAAAHDVTDAGSHVPLYVSVQVELAWGQLTGGSATTFVGIAQDRSDFPFITALGLSSYPYLGGFADPAHVPDDYFARLTGASLPPVLVTEGGWSSANVATVHSSPALQAAWIRRAASLLDAAHAVAWFQLPFTDLDLVAFGLPADDPQLVPFSRLGLVDTALTAKPSLAVWDSVFALSRTEPLSSRVALVQGARARIAGSGRSAVRP